MSNLSDYLNIEHREDGSYLKLQYGEFRIEPRSVEFAMDPQYGWSGPPHNRHAPVVERHRLEMNVYLIPPPPPKPKRRFSDLGLRRPK